jgi:hypothetical protein
MVNHKKLSVYLPEELDQVLIAYQEQQKFETASDAVVEILSQFFQKDNELKRYATVEQLDALENKVTHLSKQVTQLCQITASSAPREASRTIASKGIDYTLESTSIEEEDEPDEILSGFLEQ